MTEESKIELRWILDNLDKLHLIRTYALMRIYGKNSAGYLTDQQLHIDIPAFLNITRRTMRTHLKRMIKLGWIERRYNKIKFTSLMRICAREGVDSRVCGWFSTKDLRSKRAFRAKIYALCASNTAKWLKQTGHSESEIAKRGVIENDQIALRMLSHYTGRSHETIRRWKSWAEDMGLIKVRPRYCQRSFDVSEKPFLIERGVQPRMRHKNGSYRLYIRQPDKILSFHSTSLRNKGSLRTCRGSAHGASYAHGATYAHGV